MSDRSVGIALCRGCCCGNPGKHPGVDHRGQAERLARLARTGAVRLRTTDCLDACSYANVLVVSPSPAGRRRGGRPVWLGLVLDDTALAAVEQWVADGGPGIAALPDLLDLHRFTPPRAAVRALGG